MATLSDQLIDRAGWWPRMNRVYARRLMPIVVDHLTGYRKEVLFAISRGGFVEAAIRYDVIQDYRKRYGNPLLLFILSAIASALIKMLIEWLIENWDANHPRLRELR